MLRSLWPVTCGRLATIKAVIIDKMRTAKSINREWPIMSRVPVVAIMFLLAGSHLAYADVPSPERIESLRTYLQKEAIAFRLPGLAVAIVGPETVSEVMVDGADVSPTSAFLIGSCSKTVTALATLVALQEASIAVDTPLKQVLPTLRFAGQEQPVTIRNLLEHRSGLSRRDGFTALPPLRELQRNGETLHAVDEPSRVYRYSNLNYAILGLVIEQVTGHPYADFVERRIFRPIAMENSYAGPPPKMAELAPEYQYWFGFPLRVAPIECDPQSFPAGFVRCSIEDLSRFWCCLMNEGRHDGRQVFPSELIREMATPSGGAEYGYGMGLSRSHFPVVGSVLAHEGATPTGYACMAWFPDRNYALLLLTNVNLFDPFTDPGSDIFKNAVRVVEGELPNPLRPYKIWLRYAVVLGAIYVAWQFLRRLRTAATNGWQLRMPKTKSEWGSLLCEVLIPVAIWCGLLWWTGISLGQFLMLEPDLAWAFLLMTVIGVLSGWLKKLSTDNLTLSNANG